MGKMHALEADAKVAAAEIEHLKKALQSAHSQLETEKACTIKRRAQMNEQMSKNGSELQELKSQKLERATVETNEVLSRNELVSALFNAADYDGSGSLDLGEFALVLGEWEPEFDVDAVISTFSTCGVQTDRINKEHISKWLDKVMGVLDDAAYRTAIKDLIAAVRRHGTAKA